MMQDTGAARTPTDDYVEFWSAGQVVKVPVKEG